MKPSGAEGFEPANVGTKNRCLTTWRRPIDSVHWPIHFIKKSKKGAASKSSDTIFLNFFIKLWA